LFFWSGLRKIFLIPLNVLLIPYYRLTTNLFNIFIMKTVFQIF